MEHPAWKKIAGLQTVLYRNWHNSPKVKYPAIARPFFLVIVNYFLQTTIFMQFQQFLKIQRSRKGRKMFHSSLLTGHLLCNYCACCYFFNYYHFCAYIFVKRSIGANYKDSTLFSVLSNNSSIVLTLYIMSSCTKLINPSYRSNVLQYQTIFKQ